ncbi:MAG: ribonuclease HII [Burkholderiales bacterium]|nr:MAG: ribonuclease HII [Burkholderiales bacterium]
MNKAGEPAPSAHADLFADTWRGRRVCGADEAGRGPLAGPVVAAAVILDQRQPIDGLRDSKLLSPARRQQLALAIRRRAAAWAVAEASVQEIDELNILQASLLAMKRAIELLDPAAEIALIDGNRLPRLRIEARAIIGGDALQPSISAASILAKEHRDRLMAELDLAFPGYGFAEHAGYPTPRHLQRLRELGPCAAHRSSFAPVRELLQVAPRR